MSDIRNWITRLESLANLLEESALEIRLLVKILKNLVRGTERGERATL